MNRPILRAVVRAVAANSRRFSTQIALPVRTNGAKLFRAQLFPASVRCFSTNQGVLAKQAADSLNKAKEVEAMILDEHTTWIDLEPFWLDEVVTKIGQCRDFLNSLSAEEFEAAEKLNGVASATDKTEDLLRTVLKADELANRLHHLQDELEDVGTTGDGDNKPGAFRKEWEDETKRLFTAYSELLESAKDEYVHRLEKDLGYRFLFFKRTVHIESFRYIFPKVHPSGFSTSSD